MIIFVIVPGCSQNSANDSNKSIVESSSSGSHKSLLFVNGVELQTIGETAEELDLEPAELIGTVKEKLNIEERPKNNLTSNYLEVGTEIYSVKGKSDVVLAKKENGEYEVFE